jgi:hypothetical protein
VFPLRRPSKLPVNARTVLDGKGSLRRAKHRRALAISAPFRPTPIGDGRLRREHLETCVNGKGRSAPIEGANRPRIQTRQPRGVDKVAPYQNSDLLPENEDLKSKLNTRTE